MGSDARGELRPFAAERLLMEELPRVEGERVLCNSLGRAQLAVAAAERVANGRVVCHFLDLYRHDLARTELQRVPSNLALTCTADFPAEEFDAVALAFSHSGEAELTRELLQQGRQHLREKGQMLVATDNPRDTWLAEQMATLFDKVSRYAHGEGVVYDARKSGPPKRVRDFSCEFAFRDRGKLIRAWSRPGVFSHRRIDPGARKLLEILELSGGERVLDIGCGCGVISVAAAMRANGVSVLAIDSHTRAIECTRRCADLNGVNTIDARLTATGEIGAAGTFDVVLANPPYYADFRIVELFAETGQRALKPGSQIHFVTKSPQWYEENLPRWFIAISILPAKNYFVATARQR